MSTFFFVDVDLYVKKKIEKQKSRRFLEVCSNVEIVRFGIFTSEPKFRK
jgi:hypothetical protein